MIPRNIDIGRLAWILILSAASFFVSMGIGGFTRNQSGLLTFMVFALLYPHAFPARTLRPFAFTIYPEWKEILLDHKLITETGFKQLQQFVSQPPGRRCDLLDSIAVTVLSPELYYFKKYGTFRTNYNSREPIVTVVPEDDVQRSLFRKCFPAIAEKSEFMSWRPYLYLEDGVLGLVTHESSMKGSDINMSDPAKKIPLATLPSGLFTMYASERWSRRESVRIANEFLHLGWERNDTRDHNELPLDYTEHRHKYFRLVHSGL